MTEIEDTVFNDFLPVNSRAMLSRLTEIMKENGTNCLRDIRTDIRVRKVMWLLVNQIESTFDIYKEYTELDRLEKQK